MSSTTNSTVPHPDCFVNPTSHFGTIVNTKIIHDFPTRKSKEKVWRIWVRVRTDAGWVLMGYIGNATKESDLPPITKGDRIMTDPLVLSDWNLKAGQDYRPKAFDRQITGKRFRAGYPTVGVDEPKPTFDDFDCPPIFALMNPYDVTDCIAFIPSAWDKSAVRVSNYSKYEDGIWRWIDAGTLTKVDAVAQWKEFVGKGWTPRNLVTDPLNGDELKHHISARYAAWFGSGSNFEMLVQIWGNGNYPKKTV